MLIPSFKEISEVAESRYALVVLASKRARKIIDGSEPFREIESTSPVSIAINEIINNDVLFGEKMSDKDYEEKIKKEKLEKLEVLKNSSIETSYGASQEEF